ncbi:MAG: ATP-grasp domain-containing protein [Bacteroidales bacterium]|nr:ATP-grasp domain-containing protein [Candidatus Colimorpha merdihippi]
MNEVIIMGSNHHNTLGLVRSFGQMGVRPHLVIVSEGDECFVAKSKYVQGCKSFKDIDDSLRYVMENYCDPNGRNVLVTSAEEFTEAIDDNRDRLLPYFHLPVCEEKGRVRQLMDKAEMTSFAERCGITVPGSWVVRDRQMNEAIEFPCITKALSSTEGSKSDMKICRSRAELEAWISNPEHCANYIVQQYIKKEREVCVLGVVLQHSHEVVLSGYVEKIRASSGGGTLYAVLKDKSDLGEEAERLVRMMRETGYTGLFSAEYIVRDGKYYFLEVNFRNDATCYVSTAAGLNLPFLWYRSCIEPNIVIPEMNQMHLPCYFMTEISDLRNLKNSRKITVYQWIRDLLKADCLFIFDKHDPKPFWSLLRSVASKKKAR